MATKLPATDLVTVGLGWTGSMVAKSMTDAGLRVVSIERGPWRDTATDFPPTYSPDELRFAVRYDMFVRTAQSTPDISEQTKSNGAADTGVGRVFAA